jgi:putative MATE family efflux protein
MALVVGIILAAAGRAFSGPILGLFFGGAEESVFNIGISYLNIILISLPFFVLDIIVSGAMRGAGDTMTPMVITGFVNIFNIILNSILVFGVPALGIAAMGAAGSAAAVTTARIVSVTVRIIVLYNHRRKKISLSFKDDYRIKTGLMKRIVNIGIPGFLEQAIMQGGFLVVQIIIVTIGTTAMAAYQIGININALAFFPIFGFAIANTTLVGQSLGEKQYEKAENYAYESLKISMAAAFSLGLIMVIFARQLTSIYSDDPVLIRESIGIVRTFGVIEPLIGILNLCSATLKAAGDIKYVMITSFIGLWSLRVVMTFGLNSLFGMGLTAVMIGIFFDFTARSVMYLMRMRKGSWKYLRV